ncbi:hypothetical protein SKAU_G00004420 [Synaphobranchus kaupii]|uniref:Uncharacterized protein n=1 Tax=Synaphobranchus kaupii TaxID=118154 RepID=A0A9Q1JCX3_SYNKA|nr:hypothetical protein SKAU_G00004420 [Synaphobranchus kaupii]
MGSQGRIAQGDGPVDEVANRISSHDHTGGGRQGRGGVPAFRGTARLISVLFSPTAESKPICSLPSPIGPEQPVTLAPDCRPQGHPRGAEQGPVQRLATR